MFTLAKSISMIATSKEKALIHMKSLDKHLSDMLQ
jgi:hypothetical protein